MIAAAAGGAVILISIAAVAYWLYRRPQRTKRRRRGQASGSPMQSKTNSMFMDQQYYLTRSTMSGATTAMTGHSDFSVISGSYSKATVPLTTNIGAKHHALQMNNAAQTGDISKYMGSVVSQSKTVATSMMTANQTRINETVRKCLIYGIFYLRFSLT